MSGYCLTCHGRRFVDVGDPEIGAVPEPCPVCFYTTPPRDYWTLTAPDGQMWRGETPLKALRAERDSRIPPSQQLQRIMDALAEPFDQPSFPSDKLIWHIIENSQRAHGLAETVATNAAMMQVAQGVMRATYIPGCGNDAEADAETVSGP